MAARAIQRGIRQSARKMRLVLDTIRGRNVNEAYGMLKFSKKHAAEQIEKVLRSAVANANQDAQKDNAVFDVDRLIVAYAVANEGPTLKRFAAAALGRATPIHKRTSYVEIRVAARVGKPVPTRPSPRPAEAAAPRPEKPGKASKPARPAKVAKAAKSTKGAK